MIYSLCFATLTVGGTRIEIFHYHNGFSEENRASSVFFLFRLPNWFQLCNRARFLRGKSTFQRRGQHGDCCVFLFLFLGLNFSIVPIRHPRVAVRTNVRLNSLLLSFPPHARASWWVVVFPRWKRYDRCFMVQNLHGFSKFAPLTSTFTPTNPTIPGFD